MTHVLYIKLINPTDELIKCYQNNKNYTSDSGVNLWFPTDIELARTDGVAAMIGLGIKCKMNYDGGYRVVPRSSIVKTPIRMANSEGIIDRDYRGEIKVAVDVLGSHSIKSGTSLFQVVAHDLKPIRVVLVDDLDDTERGEGGFGSTDNRK